MVRDCKAMAEEESRSGWYQVEEQAWKNQSRGLEDSQNVESKLKSGSFIRMSRTTKLFVQDVPLTLMRKVTEWGFNNNLKR